MRTTIACAVFILASAPAAQAGINVWTSHGPQVEVAVDALAIDPITPTTLYAWVANFDLGLFKSMDAGATWTAVNTGLPGSLSVSAITINPHTPGTLYLTSSDGVFKSTDAGADWQHIDVVGPTEPMPTPAADGPTRTPTHPPEVSISDNELAIDPHTPSTLYALAYGGVLKSTNAGATWTATNTGLSIPHSTVILSALAIDPVTPSTLYAGAEGVLVFKSTDAGATWSAASLRLPDANANVTALVIDPLTPSTLYAGTAGAGVLKSYDAGATWTGLNSGLTGSRVYTLAIDPHTPTTVYAGTDAGVFGIEQVALGTPTPTPQPTATPHAVVGTGHPDSCTEADLDAAVADGGLVTFNCGLEPVTITLTQPTGISSDTTVDGGGLITLDGNHAVRAFTVGPGIALSVENLTIVNGSSSEGAATYNGGILTVTNSTFASNSPMGLAVSGGAIYNNAGALTVTNSTFAGNSPTGSAVSGGAIYNNAGTLTVTNSTFAGNSPTGSAVSGGAIYNNAGTLTVTNSTFSGNVIDGSGIRRASGGAIYNGGILTVANSTFGGNRATGRLGGGGAISNGGKLTVTNSIIANSSAGGNCAGQLTDGGHNLDDGTSCGFSTANGSWSNTDPQLDPAGLQNNGGPTQTIALLARSPAIDAGDETICAAPPVSNLDQRGFVRPGTGATRCSIGAYEADLSGPPAPTRTTPPTASPTATPTLTPTPSTTPVPCIGDCNNDQAVTIDELLTLVNIAVGNPAFPASCPSGVAASATVDVSLIITAVNHALSGCGG